MKWLERFREKVHQSQLQVSPQANRQVPEEGASPGLREKNDFEQDFKRAWDDFRSSSTEKEKEEALDRALRFFCKITRSYGNPAQLALTLVDVRVFAFVVAKALVTDIEKLRNASPNGQLQPHDILNYFAEVQKGEFTDGSNLLFALEGLVSESLDVQPLLEAGLLSSLVLVLYRLVCSAVSADSIVPPLDTSDGSKLTDERANESRQIVVEGSVVHIMKVLARHPGAAQTLAEAERLHLMFHMVVMGGTMPLVSNSQTSKREVVAAPPPHLAQLVRHVVQILELLLTSDNGITAGYIQALGLVEVLLTPVMDFNSDTGDTGYTVSVVSLIKDSIQLSCRPESGGVRLKENFQKGRGYYYLVQLASKLLESSANAGCGCDTVDQDPTAGGVPLPLMRLLDIMGELAQTGPRESVVHPSSGVAGKAGRPPPSGNLGYKSDGMGSPSDRELDGKIRDVDAVQFFQDAFLTTDDVPLRLELLDRLLWLFASDLENYVLVQELRTMPLFIQNMADYSSVLQERVLKVLEHVVMVVNCVPEQELLSLCYLLQQSLGSPLRIAVLSFFEKLLSFDRHYKKVLREVGFLDLLVEDVKKCKPPARTAQRSFSIQNPVRANSVGVLELEREISGSLDQHIFEEATVALAWKCLLSLLQKSDGNQMVFRKRNGVAAVLPLLASSSQRFGVLKLLSCLISEDLIQAHSEELKALVGVVHTGFVTNSSGRQWQLELETRKDVLWAVWRVLVSNRATKAVFGNAQGFSLLLSVLESLQTDESFGPISLLSDLDESKATSLEDLPPRHPKLKVQMEVFSALLHVATVGVAETAVNRSLLHQCLASETFKRLLLSSGLVCEEYEETIVELLFDLALERVHSPSQNVQGLPILLQKDQVGLSFLISFQIPGAEGAYVIDPNQAVGREEVFNAGAIEAVLFFLLKFSLKLQLRVLIQVERLARAGPRNQDALTSVGCVGLLLEAVRTMLRTPSALLTCALQIIELLGSFRLSSSEVRTLGRYIWQNQGGSGGQTGKRLLEMVERMWSIGFVPKSLSSFFEFRMSQLGHACMQIPLGDRTWPPAAGYSFVCWIRIEILGSQVLSNEPDANSLNRNLSGKKLGASGPIFHIFSVSSVEERSTFCTELFMDDTGTLTLATSSSSFLSFKGIRLEEGLWYHLAVVHNKPNALAGLFHSSVAYLYINGSLRHTGKLGYSATPVGKSLQVTVGTPASQAEVCPLMWRLGSCYLYEEVLPAAAIFFMYVMGRAYRGLFQDVDMTRFIPQEACGGGNLAILESLETEQQPTTAAQKGEGSLRAGVGAFKAEGGGIVWDMEKLLGFLAQLSGRKLIFAFDGSYGDVPVSTGATTVVNLVDSISAAASPTGGLPRVARILGDVHICTPRSIADNMRSVGGVAVVLAMVEAAETREMLHLALSLLKCVLQFNPWNARDMQRCHGYHLLALFLHRRMTCFDEDNLDHLFQIATCQAQRTLCQSEKPSFLQKTLSMQEPVRQLSGAPNPVSKLVSMNTVTDSGFDISSNQSKFDDQGSSYGSISDLGGVEVCVEDSDCIVIANPDMMEHVLLDWTLWVIAPISIQLKVIKFVEQLVSMHRYRNHNLAVLRRLNLVRHLLVTLQRGDVENLVLEAVVALVALILKDGFMISELKVVADFVVMTFDPIASLRGLSSKIREPWGKQVIVRNMLLEKLIDLQFSIKTDEVKTEEWHKVVSSKIITFLLDEAVHPTSMQRIMTLLGVCLSTSTTFAVKFKSTGGHQALVRVLPSFCDSPEVYFVLFSLLFNESVYPRQPEVRMLDFQALMPSDEKAGEICFPELLEAVIAMCKATFDRVSKQSLAAQQSGNFSEFSASLARSFSDLTEDSGEGLQGVALLHKTYAARLMGGEAAAPALVTSLLRFMVDLAKMCLPFSVACRRTELLESFVDLYFSCVRSAGAVQAAQEVLAQSLESEQGVEMIFPEDNLPAHVIYLGSQKTNGFNGHASKLEKDLSEGLIASSLSDHSTDNMSDMFIDATTDAAGSLQSLRPSSPSVGGTESSFRWAQGGSPTASELSSAAVTPKIPNVGSPVGSFQGLQLPNEAFVRLRTASLIAVPVVSRSEGDMGSRLRSTSQISTTPQTPQSEVDSSLSEFGRSSGHLTPRECSDSLVTPRLILQLEAMGTGGGPCAAGAAAILDLIAEVLAETLAEQQRGLSVVEAALEAVPLFVGSEVILVFQGLCLGRMINFLERRLLRDEEEHSKKLDKNRWAPNLDALSWLLVDRVFMGAFAEPGGPLKVLDYLLAMLQLANADGRVEDATPAGKGLLALARGGGRQVEPHVHALLKNTNRMLMFCLLPSANFGGFPQDSVSSSLRHSSGSVLGSIESIRGSNEGGPGELGVCSPEVDKAAVLQSFLANKKLILCASNVDSELLCALSWNVTPLLWDADQSIQSLAVDVWRALVLHRSPALEDILIWKGTQGAEAVDVLHGGFNLLLTAGLTDFMEWIKGDTCETVMKVLEARAGAVWKEFVAGTSRFLGTRIKPLEGRRKREMTRRAKETLKIDNVHREQVSKTRSSLDQGINFLAKDDATLNKHPIFSMTSIFTTVRESVGAELRVLRQDKYGWVLHAESEWAEHIQQLVHERGIWPMVSAPLEGEPCWQLCATEGPFRMRKKLERRKINPEDIYLTNLEGDDTPGLAESRRGSLGREGTPPPLHMDHPDQNNLFPLVYLGSDSQKHMSFPDKEFLATFEDEDDQSKGDGIDDDGKSSSARLQWSDDHHNINTSGLQLETNSATLIEDPPRVTDSPRVPQSPRETEKNLHIVDAQNPDLHVQEDGEYLIRPYLEPGEKLKFRYNCERVVGLEKRDGIFLIGEQCLYVIESCFIDEESGCIKEKGEEEEVSVIDRALGVQISGTSDQSQDIMKQPSGVWVETVQTSWRGGRAWAYNGGAWGKEKVQEGRDMQHAWRMWKLESVHELLKRRYQLRPVAIELFCMDGCNDLLVFHKNERDEVFKNLLSMNLPRNSMLDRTISGVSNQDGNEGGRLFKIMAKSFSKRWQNGEISNFQYLMHLNTLAGRGYNDLTQYPVFPWILADYESEELDLSKPETFRCLEKPMGAHQPTREEEFKKRFESWEDPEIPRFHYGSHYSSAGTVLFYLIRLPPFSWDNRQLQGGQFDHADRLFNSLLETWLSASQGNTADVKELIPEFFYLPEFLENRFDFDFGVKQCGEKVDNVVLPPWAKGSAREFVQKHREALESQYVSENLHHWIDLIFGFKQRGKAAVDATNVFYHLTYEGAVDIDSVPDPAMKAAVLAQINHFGQTPRQLFLKPHPKRKWVQKQPLAYSLRNYHLLAPQEVRTLGSKVSQIVMYQDKPYVATANRILRPPFYDKYVAWGFPDRSLRFISYDQEKLLSTHENLHGDDFVQCAGFSRDGRILVTGGVDGVVAVWRTHNNSLKLQLQRTLCAHTQAVTCLAVSQSYSLVLSASKDCSVIFWDLTSLEYVRQLRELSAPATAIHTNEMSGEVVTAVGATLTVWSINGDCLAAVNTSQLSSDTILSITSPNLSDWMEASWYLTGHQNGVIRLWHMKFDAHTPTNKTALTRSRSEDPFSTPEKAVRSGFRSATSTFSGLGRLGSAIESAHSDLRLCITGKTPEYQLVLCKVLAWHKQPVTALSLASEMKQLCSGDSGGHVVLWTLPDDVSKNPPQPDTQFNECSSCQTYLAGEEKRHHCRNCGQILCANCSKKHHLVLEDLGYFSPVRVCSSCFESRKAPQPFSAEEAKDRPLPVLEPTPSLKSVNLDRSESSKF